MSRNVPQFRIVVTDPNGTETDLSDRASLDAGISTTEETEADLLQITHSELELALIDNDGAMTTLLGSASRGDRWQIVVERERLDGSGFDRIFGGVLFFPVVIDPGEREVRVTAYGFTKLLEDYSAEVVKRTITGRTGTGYIANNGFSVSDSDGFVVGDKVSIGLNGGEEHVISAIGVGSITIVDTLTSNHTNEPVELVTPYYRGQTAEQLATILYALAGITDVQVDIAQELSSIPFPTSMNFQGLPANDPAAITEKGGKIVVTASTGGTMHRFEATNATSGFTDTGVGNVADWRPYLVSEPGFTEPSVLPFQVWDYNDPGHYYGWANVAAGANTELWLTKDGVNLVKIDTIPNGATTASIWPVNVEPSPGWGEVWISYIATWSAVLPHKGHTVYHYRTRTYRVVLSGPTATKITDTYATLGSCAKTGTLLVASQVKVSTPDSTDSDVLDPAGRSVILYDHGAQKLVLATPNGNAYANSFRAFNSYYAAIVAADSGGTAIALWNQSDGSIVSQPVITSTATATNIATTFRGALTEDEYEGFGGGVYFSVSRRASGVIPYADFSGLSVCGALKELAIVTGSHFWVDEYKVGYLIARKSARLTGADPVDIDDPLMGSTTRPIWEWLRRSITVSGSTETGTSVEVSVGESGDSSTALSISTQLPVNEAFAGAIGSAYLAFLGAEREQRDWQIVEPVAGRVRFLGRARAPDGRSFLAIRVETEHVERVQTLQLVEV